MKSEEKKKIKDSIFFSMKLWSAVISCFVATSVLQITLHVNYFIPLIIIAVFTIILSIFSTLNWQKDKRKYKYRISVLENAVEIERKKTTPLLKPHKFNDGVCIYCKKPVGLLKYFKRWACEHNNLDIENGN